MNQIPVKAVKVSGAATALAEFESGDAAPVAHGGTGATTPEGARESLGLGALAQGNEPPDDGKQYARAIVDGVPAWVETAASGGGGGVFPKLAVFTTSGTFTLPATALPHVEYDLAGGGAAGGAVQSTSPVTGGGGGARLIGSGHMTPGATYTVVIGSGGVGDSTPAGVAGGDTSIVGFADAPGGRTGGVSGDGIRPALLNDSMSNTSGAAAFLGSSAAPLPSQTGSGGICSAGAVHHLNANNTVYIVGAPGQGAGAAAIDANGGDATGIGCGGGAARRSGTGATVIGGNGFRGQCSIKYWDTEP